jgi:pimeloyl-ACP methyl ester carboxylesterase
MKQQIRFCRSRDDVRIAFATAGEGPPLVRVNNWFTHLELDWDNPVWRHWSEALAERRMLVRYDPRGSGLSDRDVTDFALDAMVADLEAVVDALKLRRFPLLGLCQGGVIAIAYAARHPERVSRLVLYDSYPYGAFVHDAGEKLAKQARAFSQMLLWPLVRAFAALDSTKQQLLGADLIALAERFNRANRGSLVAPGQYAEVVIKRK